MNATLRRQVKARKRRLRERICKTSGQTRTPMIKTPRITYELAQRQQAVACGGIGAIMEVIKQSDLRKQINGAVPLFKWYAPYDEADHVLNIALNLLAGGTCLEHLEIRRNDEAYLDALGAIRIPDPTTAGDFCRRFGDYDVMKLAQAINQSRLKVWRQQSPEFFQQATIEADGTMVETRGEKKSGIGMNYKGQWGYHPLVVTLAQTQEVLFVANRSGNRPSHEGAAFYFDQAIELCRKGRFQKIVLRGDTDFALTTNFDRWSEDHVEFIFGIDAMPNLVAIAETLETEAWSKLERKRPPSGVSEAGVLPREKRPNHKQEFVIEREYQNLRLRGETYAEFDYQPGNCSRSYRVVAVRKEIDVSKGQQWLFEQVRYFFYITNAKRSELSARAVIKGANDRCDQENTISQLKACGALSAPLNDLVSNGAYMLMGSLAWTLKAWSGLLIRVNGRQAQREARREARRRILRMEFATYLNAIIHIPAQIIRTARKLCYRLLTYRPSVDLLLLIHDQIIRPLRT